jgi:methyl-accepting chemotaxis protein
LHGFAAFASRAQAALHVVNTQREWFTDAKKAAGRIVFSEPYVDADTSEVIITISMTVYNRNGTDIGVAADDVEVNYLGELLREMRNFTAQEIFIINNDGLFITHDNINAVMEKDFFTEFGLERYRHNVLDSDDFFIIDQDVLLYSSVMPNIGWILVSTIPTSVVFAETNRFIISLIIISLLILLGVAVISVIFTHRMLTSPLRGMLQVTDSLARMDFTVNISKFRTDEIGDIQYALMEIRDNLKEGIDSLHAHLEKSEATERNLNSLILDSYGALETITTGIDNIYTKDKLQTKSIGSATDSAAEISSNASESEQQ